MREEGAFSDIPSTKVIPVWLTDSSNVAAACADAVHSHADATGRLGDTGTLLQSVVDAL